MRWRVVEVEGTRVVLREGKESIPVKTYYNGERDKVKNLLEERYGKKVVFLGELWAQTG